MPIRYRVGDLFEAPHGVLAHACNVHGVWGGGIALIFKRKFPEAYRRYAQHCHDHKPQQLLGTCFLIPEGPYQVACLFTNDGNVVDEIADYTARAVRDLVRQLPPDTVIQMPQINAGIFGVPWKVTERALLTVDAPIDVYKLN